MLPNRRDLGRLLSSSLFAYPATPLRPVPFPKVSLTDAFWSPRLAVNSRVTVPACFRKCEESGHIDNFKKAARQIPGSHSGTAFYDGPLYKTIEGAAYSLISTPDPALDRYLDNLISILAAAQEPDGYLYTARTIDPAHAPAAAGPERWSNLAQSHELFLAGHLYEAAVAHFQATGKRSLLDVALRNANLIDATFGAGKRPEVPGHQEIELALIRLAEVTGEARYSALARHFLLARGRYAGRVPGGIPKNPKYSQDHLPVLEQTEAVGHAVRAVYQYAAMAAIAPLSRVEPWTDACLRLWANIVSRKTYLTGGLGARPEGEAFGDDYELPNDTAYAETCASIGSVFFNHRLFLLTGDAKFLDVLERTLYNGLLSGVSFDGERFFYPNVLASDGKRPFNMGSPTRQPWFKVACCPTNVARFLPSLPGYIYSHSADAIHVALYVGSRAVIPLDAGPVSIEQSSGYPWSGGVRLTVNPVRPSRFALHLRIPGWAAGMPIPSDLYSYVPAASPSRIRATLNGSPVAVKPERGFLRIERVWKSGDRLELDLPMPVRRVVCHAAVKANLGRVALERGPLVYCFEAADNGASLDQLAVSDRAPLATAGKLDIAGGVTTLSAGRCTAIPYFAWSHRGPNAMQVWAQRA